MVTEFWWRVFLAAVLTAATAKLLGCPWGVLLLFSVAYISWAVGLILILALGVWVHTLWKSTN